MVFVLAALLIGILSAPQPSQAQASIVVNMPFEYLRQGTAGVLSISGPDIAGGVVSVLDRNYTFFPVTGGFAALISVPIETRIKRDYPMKITVYQAKGGTLNWDGLLSVQSGEFIREPLFSLPSDRFYLLDWDIQANEDLRLKTIYSTVTPERYWEGLFTLPVNGTRSSPFGSVRDYNDGSTRRHTGSDFSVPQGTPVLASASGKVAFARGMDIHGNIVAIDHGWGVFSSYSHLREIYVVPGQYVLQGQVIGLSGNTGRSTGPHVHWEIAVNGIWINPLEFIAIKLPS